MSVHILTIALLVSLAVALLAQLLLRTQPQARCSTAR